MSSDFDEIDQILKRHFENITPEEFKSNLKAACPSLFESPKEVIHEKKESIYSTEDFLSSKSDDAEYQEIDRILTEHFEKITPEEFKRNLEIACPSWINTPSIPAITKKTPLRTFGLISVSLFAVALFGAIFSTLQPSENSITASISKPIEVGDSLIYEYLRVSDKSGKKASINVVLLSSRYRWKIEQDKILQDSDDDKKNIAIDKLSENLQRDGVYEVIKSNGSVSRIISIGTASCEGFTKNEENRAKDRALATNKFVVQKMFAVGQYSFINLGKFKKDDCNPSPEKTSWQRALIILGVRQEEEGVNITEAVRARLAKIPVELKDYSLGDNDNFQVRDIKSE
jgi:hypothetical protein